MDKYVELSEEYKAAERDMSKYHAHFEDYRCLQDSFLVLATMLNCMHIYGVVYGMITIIYC